MFGINQIQLIKNQINENKLIKNINQSRLIDHINVNPNKYNSVGY